MIKPRRWVGTGTMVLLVSCASGWGGDEPRTVAEASGFQATSTHAEVVAFCDALCAANPLVRRGVLGRSEEGRELPLLVLSDPAIEGEDLAKGVRARAASGVKPLVVLAIGNIHAGEVDGKEALLALVRDLARERPAMLKELVLVVAPIYNADGNERMAKDNRPGQLGPAQGQGQRGNAKGLDLNRDGVKLDAAETRALVGALRAYDPHVFIDAHTTDGSFHRYIMTYEGPKAPAGDAALIAYTRETFFPAVSARFASATAARGWDSFFYGNFEAEWSGGLGAAERSHTRWETFPAEARFLTTYVGLRSRLSILTESYSYAPYEDRVRAQHIFMDVCLQELHSARGDIIKLVESCDARTIDLGARGEGRVAIKTKMVAGPKPAFIKGFVERMEGGRSVPTQTPTEYEVKHYDRFEGTMYVNRPRRYVLLPGIAAGVKETLAAHGVQMREVAVPEVMTGAQKYNITSTKSASREFQRRVLVSVQADVEEVGSITLEPGCVVVETAQPLGNLVVYLLEPACEDGFAAWNMMGAALTPVEGVYGAYPVLRGK